MDHFSAALLISYGTRDAKHMQGTTIKTICRVSGAAPVDADADSLPTLTRKRTLQDKVRPSSSRAAPHML